MDSADADSGRRGRGCEAAGPEAEETLWEVFFFFIFEVEVERRPLLLLSDFSIVARSRLFPPYHEAPISIRAHQSALYDCKNAFKGW